MKDGKDKPKADGSRWSWDSNKHGQLGDNTTTDRNRPVRELFSLQPVYLPHIWR
jgi:hypothetical protein